MTSQDYLDHLRRLYYDIQVDPQNKRFLSSDFEQLTKYNCRSEQDALNRLFGFSFENRVNKRSFKSVIQWFETLDFNILIAGSSALAAVMSFKIVPDFEPSDMDIYVTNIDQSKIDAIDRVLRKCFCVSSNSPSTITMIIVRRPLTISWIVVDLAKNQVLAKIQLSTLHIQSWSEIFILYHSDIVCIGYDVQSQKFLYLRDRFLTHFLQPRGDGTTNVKVHFTNLHSDDCKETLESSVLKYQKRGFSAEAIYVKRPSFCWEWRYSGSNHTTDSSIKSFTILGYFYASYQNARDVVISHSTSNVFSHLNLVALTPNLLLASETQQKEWMSFYLTQVPISSLSNCICPVYWTLFSVGIYDKVKQRVISLQEDLHYRYAGISWMEIQMPSQPEETSLTMSSTLSLTSSSTCSTNSLTNSDEQSYFIYVEGSNCKIAPTINSAFDWHQGLIRACSNNHARLVNLMLTVDPRCQSNEVVQDTFYKLHYFQEPRWQVISIANDLLWTVENTKSLFPGKNVQWKTLLEAGLKCSLVRYFNPTIVDNMILEMQQRRTIVNELFLNDLTSIALDYCVNFS